MKSSKKQNRVFSTEFKKEKVAQIEQGKLKVAQISKMYGVSTTAVYYWVDKYSKLPKDERMVVEKLSEEIKTLELLKKVGELENIIGQQQIEIIFQKTVIEHGSKIIGEDLKKKFATQ
jgi:transposase-like protein